MDCTLLQYTTTPLLYFFLYYIFRTLICTISRILVIMYSNMHSNMYNITDTGIFNNKHWIKSCLRCIFVFQSHLICLILYYDFTLINPFKSGYKRPEFCKYPLSSVLGVLLPYPSLVHSKYPSIRPTAYSHVLSARWRLALDSHE